MHISRRRFIGSAMAGAVALSGHRSLAQSVQPPADLAGEVGIAASSFMQSLREDPALHQTFLLDLPERARNELDMRVIDLMTGTFPSFEPRFLDRLRSRAERHGCILVNLKMNQQVNIADPNPEQRREAMDEYRRSIDVANRLGCRWVRVALRGPRPDMTVLVAQLRELIDYAAAKSITVLVETSSWIRTDPGALPDLIATVGPGLAAAPDIGAWTDETRFEGLRRAFPLAVMCDFKAFNLGPNGEHELYDLKKCFEVGWAAGFRGPWCIELSNPQTSHWHAFAVLRDLLREWMRAAA